MHNKIWKINKQGDPNKTVGPTKNSKINNGDGGLLFRTGEYFM